MNDELNVYKEELLKILQDTVKIKSINPPGLELAMCDYVYEYMKNFNEETYKFEVEKDRYDIVSIIRGKKSENGIIFTGHMDVVPVSEDEYSRWDVDPFSGEIQGDFLFGRGSSDMKSGLCSAMVSMKYLKEKGITPLRDIALVATIDEEDSMKGSKKLVENELLKNFSEVVVCEPTNLEICNVGRGRTYGVIDIKGQTGHGSQYGIGKNAILIANVFINKMMEEDFEEESQEIYGKSFWQPLAINAGVEPCVVPDDCKMKIDARLAPEHFTQNIWDKVDVIIEELQKEIPGFKATVEIIDRREPWITDLDSNIMKNMKEVYDDLGVNFITTDFKGTTDGTIFKIDGRDIVIIGPGDLSKVHKENECVSIKDLYKSLEIYTELMKK